MWPSPGVLHVAQEPRLWWTCVSGGRAPCLSPSCSKTQHWEPQVLESGTPRLTRRRPFYFGATGGQLTSLNSDLSSVKWGPQHCLYPTGSRHGEVGHCIEPELLVFWANSVKTNTQSQSPLLPFSIQQSFGISPKTWVQR